MYCNLSAKTVPVGMKKFPAGRIERKKQNERKRMLCFLSGTIFMQKKGIVINKNKEISAVGSWSEVHGVICA
jgi:hypothetical protein